MDLITIMVFFAGTAVGAGALASFMVPRYIRAQTMLAQAGGATSSMESQFELAATRAMKAAQEQLLILANEKLSGAQKDAGHDLDKRQQAIAAMVDPMAKTLKDVETRLQALGQSGAVLDAQLKNFAVDQQALRAQTAALVGALKNTATRGNWGELQLERTLELAGLIEGTHFRQQVTITADGTTQRPDFVVDLPGKLSIVVDVKAPLEPYWAMQDNDNTQPTADHVQQFRTRLRAHLKQLAAKSYWQQFDSPQFVVMFLPTEGLFSLAVATDKTLIEDAASANVILASPTTILGLLRVIAFAWQQQALADNAKTIGALAEELQNRMATFTNYMQGVGRGLATAFAAYDKASASLNARVLPQLRKISQARGKGDGDIDDLKLLERASEDTTALDDKAA